MASFLPGTFSNLIEGSFYCNVGLLSKKYSLYNDFCLFIKFITLEFNITLLFLFGDLDLDLDLFLYALFAGEASGE